MCICITFVTKRGSALTYIADLCRTLFPMLFFGKCNFFVTSRSSCVIRESVSPPPANIYFIQQTHMQPHVTVCFRFFKYFIFRILYLERFIESNVWESTRSLIQNNKTKYMLTPCDGSYMCISNPFYGKRIIHRMVPYLYRANKLL